MVHFQIVKNRPCNSISSLSSRRSSSSEVSSSIQLGCHDDFGWCHVPIDACSKKEITYCELPKPLESILCCTIIKDGVVVAVLHTAVLLTASTTARCVPMLAWKTKIIKQIGD